MLFSVITSRISHFAVCTDLEPTDSTRLLPSAEVFKFNSTLGVFNVVLERMCHIEEETKYRAGHFFGRYTGNETHGFSCLQNFIIREKFL